MWPALQALRAAPRAAPRTQFRSLAVVVPPRGRGGLTTKALDIVQATLPAVSAAGADFAAHFYKRLFAAHPELLNTFNATNQRAGRQPKAFFSAIATSAVCVLENGTLPIALLEGVCQKHCALHVEPTQYATFGKHLIETIADLFTPDQEVLDAWGELYGALADHCMKREGELYKHMESLPGGWRGTRSFILQEKDVMSKHITKFKLVPEDGKPISTFSPGQYTTLWLHPSSWPHRQPRHYSLTSTPCEESYTIAVRKEEHGLVSSFLHDHTVVGDKIDLSAPCGNFGVAGCEVLWLSEPDAPVVLMSAGVGITPILSILASLKSGPTESRPVTWFHAAENGREHALRDYIVGLARAHPSNITRRVWYSEPTADDVRGSGSKAPYHFEGHMNLSAVKDILPLEDARTQYFLCGPGPWMKSVSHQLMDFGVRKNTLHYESFLSAEDILG